MPIKTLDDLQNIEGKIVILRADFNVPIKDGKITDSNRIFATMPTIKELLAKGANIVIISHLGRPKGEINPKYSLKPVADELAKLLKKDVEFVDDCLKKPSGNSEVTLMENLRFYAEEEANSKEFAGKLAKLGDIFVNDAFSTAHRAHGSTYALAKLLPAYAGRLMQREIDALTKALDNPKRPVIAVVGGAKISTKLAVLNNLIKKTDKIILGGGMANSFLVAKGLNIGISLQEKTMHDEAKNIMHRAQKYNCEIILPEDVIIASELVENIDTQEININNIPQNKMILDIGSKTIEKICFAIKQANTVLWNGPLGAFEIKPFDCGTNKVAQFTAKLTDEGKIISIAGGGDTVSALANAGVKDDFSYISTAGGAFLEWIEGKSLPAIEILQK